MALISVMSVMNGLQLGFIEDILEIHSYHLRIEAEESIYLKINPQLNQMDAVESTAYFRDTQTLVQGEYSEYHSIQVRGVHEGEAGSDTGLMEQLEIIRGSFSLRGDDKPGVVIGDQMAFHLGVQVGDTLQMISMEGTGFASMRPQNTSFVVTGIFHSGYYQYDSALCFIDLDRVNEIDTATAKGVIGIKIGNRFRDDIVKRKIEQLLLENGIELQVESWRVYNRSFFSALRVEKMTMMILLCLIFIVVAVNIKNSLERSVIERKEEIGILRAVGAAPVSIRLIFLVEGGLIAVIGAFSGTLLGMLVSININEVFRLTELVVNGAVRIIGTLFFTIGGMKNIEIFPTSVFYMQEVPVRMMYSDVLIIVLFAIAASISAAYFASRRMSDFSPTEILRNE